MKIFFCFVLFLSANAFSKEIVSSETAVFAGGCFWCMEPPFDKLNGVLSTISGYSGGTAINPTYESVSQKNSDHREVIEITFDSKKISYEELLDVFWKNIDPHDDKGQFCDKGNQYKSAIYYRGDHQQKAAEASRDKRVKSLKNKIVTELLPAKTFYAAEDYHQDYYKKNPIRYKYYRTSCGRDRRLEEVWGK